jgi:tetratricopeptide (TPR) repeat protein
MWVDSETPVESLAAIDAQPAPVMTKHDKTRINAPWPVIDDEFCSPVMVANPLSLVTIQVCRRRLAAAVWLSPVVATALLGMEAAKAAESWGQRPASLASSLISQAVQPVGSPYNKAMRLGYAASERGDYTAATNHFREALLDVPEDREATIAYWNARKALHAKLTPRDRTPSESAYDKAMRQGYDETHARDYQSALINFQRALNERPDDTFAAQAVRNVSAYIAAQKGQPLSQIEQAELNVASQGYAGESSYDRYMRLGYAAAKEKNHTLAADYFRSALLDRPDDRMATIAFWNQKHALIQAASGRPAAHDAAGL